MKFRKKPVVIDAEQYNGPVCFEKGVSIESKELPHGVVLKFYDQGFDQYPVIETLEGIMAVRPGDWIIKGINGEFYPCKPDIFEKTYEPFLAPKQAEGE